jgi:hypothetical protein
MADDDDDMYTAAPLLANSLAAAQADATPPTADNADKPIDDAAPSDEQRAPSPSQQTDATPAVDDVAHNTANNADRAHAKDARVDAPRAKQAKHQQPDAKPDDAALLGVDAAVSVLQV